MENKDLIGRKVKGFAFESHPNEFKLQYTVWMESYINRTGVIKSYDEFLDAYCVLFEEGTDDEQSFHYPASEIEKHLIEEKDWSVTIDSPTQHYDQDLLDKFALQSLPNIISRISINATHQDIAKECYDIARAMIKERIKNGN